MLALAAWTVTVIDLVRPDQRGGEKRGYFQIALLNELSCRLPAVLSPGQVFDRPSVTGTAHATDAGFAGDSAISNHQAAGGGGREAYQYSGIIMFVVVIWAESVL